MNQSSQTTVAQIVQILLPHVWSVEDRKDLLLEAFRITHDYARHQVNLDAPTPLAFANGCVITLAGMPNGSVLLATLLLTVWRRSGEQIRIAIDQVIPHLPELCAVILPKPDQSAEWTDSQLSRPAIFFSFAREDGDLARRLATDLERHGHACRLDEQAKKDEDAWLAATAEGLSNAYAVVLVAGQYSAQDRWVQVELLAAMEKRKQVFAAAGRDARLPGFLTPAAPAVDFAHDYESALATLLEQLPVPPAGPFAAGWASLSPALLARADELVYMDRLKLAELKHVAQYTRLSGKSHLRRASSGRLEVTSVVARQELIHARWRRELEAPVDERRFEDAVPELKVIGRAVLLGEPGAGKTTTLYKLAADLMDDALFDRAAPVPLMVRLGLWRRADQSFADFLRQSVGAVGDGLETRLRDRRVALLLDGLNEIPSDQQADKYAEVGRFLKDKDHAELMAILTCREQDYPTDRALTLDRVTVAPLDPVRIHEFIHNYFDADPEAAPGAADDLFWQLAGEGAEESYRDFEVEVGRELAQPFQTFWLAESLPRGGGAWGEWGEWSGPWNRWLRQRAHPASLMELARNPYMLFMLLDVYRASGGVLPANRGGLFDAFVETLLLRERLIEWDVVTGKVVSTPAAEALLADLAALAFAMQQRRPGQGRVGGAMTSLSLAEAASYLTEPQRYQGASANLLALGDEVRFTHQLLQEYFVARAMRERIFGANAVPGKLKAESIWPPDRWWEPTNWEEATILLAGLYSDDCSAVLTWLQDANPEVAARCIVESGAHTPYATKLALRARWLPRLTDLERDSDARARAAVGRALGMVTLADGTPLDNRPGVGFIVKGNQRLPDIAWGEPVPAGTYTVGGDKRAYRGTDSCEVRISRPYQLSRYPVTFVQFDCFVTAPDFADERWWAGMPAAEEAYGTTYRVREIGAQAFPFSSQPRENVSWYQAMAFCRWLSDKLGYDVELPDESEWEVAARYPDGRFYPWGNQWDVARANTNEDNRIGRTSAVGIFPNGHNPALGLYDLSGNVWEWCANKVDEPADITVDTSGARRVVRGGSWDYNRIFARAAYRYHDHPYTRDNYFGFRVVRRPPSHGL